MIEHSLYLASDRPADPSTQPVACGDPALLPAAPVRPDPVDTLQRENRALREENENLRELLEAQQQRAAKHHADHERWLIDETDMRMRIEQMSQQIRRMQAQKERRAQ